MVGAPINNEPEGLLDGLLVLDMSQFLAGPYASLRLRDLGARVIKIERPDGGDLCRRLYLSDTEIGGDSTLFHAINRNKESLALDLKNPGDLASLRELIARADVLIQNFRPGVVDRLGLGYDEVAKLNPKLVYASITGYGGAGPWVARPGQDLLAQARSGLMWLNGDDGQGPVPFGLAVADMLAGAAAAQGILAGLVRRGMSGRGAHIETSLLETLDTTKPDDLAIFHNLIQTADVFIQNFRPGVAERLGAGEAELRALNPSLIYCAITGFGVSGPKKDRPAFDTVAQAASGFLRLIVPPENPRVIGPALADAVTGFYAGFGCLAALLERSKTGRGRRIDVSMLEAMCHFNLDSFTHYLSVGEVMNPYSRPSVSQSYIFECSDAKWVALHMSSPPKFWEGLVEAIDRPDLLTDPRFGERLARIAHHDDLIEIMRPIFKTRSRDEWCAILADREVPSSPAYNADEALDDEQARHLEIMVESTHPTMGPFRTVRSPYSFDGESIKDVVPPPVLDEHGAQIRAELASNT